MKLLQSTDKELNESPLIHGTNFLKANKTANNLL